jgi:hypothetical protein
MITRYINTASTPGGDGTTNATSGANRAFASGAEFNTSMAGSMTDNITVWCSGATADTKWGLSGWTPNGYAIYVKGNQDWTTTTAISTSKYRIVGNIGSTDVLFYVGSGQPYCYMDHVGFVATNQNNGGAASRCENGGRLYVDSCVYETTAGYNSNVDSCSGFNVMSSDGDIKNSIVRWFGTGILEASNGYNCTIINCGRGTRTIGKGRNLIYQNNGQDDFGSSPIDYVLTDGAGGWTHQVTGTTLDFVNKAAYNFHLASTDTEAVDVGVGPSSDAAVPTTDIDGTVRSGSTCDVGCDEYVAATGLTRQSDNYYRRRMQ